MNTVALGDVAEINPRLPEKPGSDEMVSFLPMASLRTDGTTEGGEERRFGEVSKGYTPFLDGDLLVAKITPCFQNNKIGQARIGRRFGVGSSEYHVVRPRPDIADARYVLHFLRRDQVRLEGERRMTGSGGQRRVPVSFLQELDLPLPPLHQQRRIAAILDQADRLQQLRLDAVVALDRLVPSLYSSMFGNPEEAIRSGRTVVLSDVVAELQGGRSLVADDPTLESRNRVLKISSVTSGSFRSDESKPLPNDYIPAEDHFVRAGDLLISRANTRELVGAVALVESAPSNLVLPDKLWRFVWRDPSAVEPLFVHAMLRTPAMRRQLSERASGTGGSMKNISKAKLQSMPLVWPNIAEQRLFADRVRAVRSHRAHHASAAELPLRSTLATRAFSGQL